MLIYTLMCLADKVCFILVQRVQQCMIDKLIEIIAYYGMEMSIGKNKVMRISKLPSTIQFTIDQKPPKNVEFFKKLGSLITNGARRTREIKSSTAMVKEHSTKGRPLSPALTA